MRYRLSRLSRLHVRNGMGCVFEGRSTFFQGSGFSFIVFSFSALFSVPHSLSLFISLAHILFPSFPLSSAQPN